MPIDARSFSTRPTPRSRPTRSLAVAVCGAMLASLAGIAALTVDDRPAGAAPAPAAAPTAAGCAISPPSGSFAQPVEWSAGHARVWRLYQAFFLRQPDAQGFDYWLRVRSQGATLSQMATTFANGPEFEARYGNLGNAAFVDLVYRNVQCRAPEASGRSYWLGLLNRGQITRWDLMINFAELREYMTRTGTCHSIYPAEDSYVPSCPGLARRPLSQATFSRDGYQAIDAGVARVGGGGGGYRGVLVDYRRGVVSTGHDRCAVASINANWTVAAEKDRPNPSALGLGVVDGRHVKGSADRSDRGVIGLRFDAAPTNVRETWPGNAPSSSDTRLSSVLWHQGVASLESWHAAAETSPYLQQLAPQEIVAPHEWVWAAAGIPVRVDGQTDPDFSASYFRDPYTYQTLRHSFVAFDQDSGRMIFGATDNLDIRDLARWAEQSGHEDLVVFDGGASTEFNVGRAPVVSSTSRDLPVWLGIGC